MNEEQKNQLKESVGKLADQMSDKALAEARKQTNKLWKVLLYCVGVALAGIAALAGFTGCEHITPEQVNAVHAIYHAASGEPCIFVVEDWKK